MWTVADLQLDSRLVLGTGCSPHLEHLEEALSGTEAGLTIVPIRAAVAPLDFASFAARVKECGSLVVPSTAGCMTPEDAIDTADLATERLGTRWLLLDVTACRRTRRPCVEGTLEAARALVGRGWTVLARCSDDPVICQRLADIGCAAVVPAAPVQQSVDLRRLAALRSCTSAALVVDLGQVSTADALSAVEVGADAVLVGLNSFNGRQISAFGHALRLATRAGEIALASGSDDRQESGSRSQAKPQG